MKERLPAASGADSLPTATEARKILAGGVERLARRTALCFCGLMVLIVLSQFLLVRRLVENFGWAAVGSPIRDVVTLPVLAVLGWISVPRLVALAYGSLIREGQLVRAAIVAGPDTISQRFRLESVLGPLEELLGRVVPTQLVTYRMDGAKSSQVGLLYEDETLDRDRDSGVGWALTTSGATGRKGWLFRRPRTARRLPDSPVPP